MGWVRLDDSFYDHLRYADASLEAIGLWVVLIAWANRNLTDGRVPCGVVDRFVVGNGEVDELIERGALEKSESAAFYELHNYLRYQPSAEKIREKREREKARWQRRGERSGSAEVSEPEAVATPPPLRGNSAAAPTASQPQPEGKEIAPNGARSRPSSQKEVYGALVEVFGDVTTSVAKSFYGKCARELRTAGAKPADVVARGQVLLGKNWSDSGPGALVKHWDRLVPPPDRRPRVGGLPVDMKG